MAAKRNKSQARRNGGGGSSAIPGWAWLLIGLLLGVGLYILVPKYLDGKSADSFFRPKPNADAQPPALDATSDDDEPLAQNNGNVDATETTAKTQDYDFYTLLPGEETALSDRELAERARAEELERQRAVEAADKPETDTQPQKPANDDDGQPPAIDAVASKTPPANDGAAPAKPDPVAGSAASVDARYLLQAGAFKASGDAESLKAKIAFLGLSARVESAEIKGQTVYRVRMGPYGTATDLAEAKRKLAAGGLPAMAIKAK